jgi:hypothetical protein
MVHRHNTIESPLCIPVRNTWRRDRRALPEHTQTHLECLMGGQLVAASARVTMLAMKRERPSCLPSSSLSIIESVIYPTAREIRKCSPYPVLLAIPIRPVNTRQHTIPRSPRLARRKLLTERNPNTWPGPRHCDASTGCSARLLPDTGRGIRSCPCCC